jgi:hypothetical protein
MIEQRTRPRNAVVSLGHRLRPATIRLIASVRKRFVDVT